MLEIVSVLNYAKFDDIKGCSFASKMWKSLSDIYGGDQKVQREKRESLRGMYDDMRMEEGENIAQYVSRIKEVVGAIRSATGNLDDEIVIRKFLRTFLPIYAIRVSTIQELRCILGNKLTLEGIVGRLTTFELSNFDNYKPKNLEFSLKAKLLLKDTEEMKPKKKKRKIKYASSDSCIDEEDVEQLEALLTKRFHRGKGKFKGKLPIICFNCNEVGHIAVRCPQKRIIEKETSTKEEEKMIKDITKTKAKSTTLLKKRILMIMVMR